MRRGSGDIVQGLEGVLGEGVRGRGEGEGVRGRG